MFPGQPAAVAALAAFGVHRLALTGAYLARRGVTARADAPAGELPRVTVQLPLYNERFVAARLIAAAAALDYPADRLEIQVLDDSDDDTRAVAAQAVAAARASGVDITHVVRDERRGFKAGALAAGMAAARGELFLVLDADFSPRPDLLHRVIGAFADPRVGFAQVRWQHANRERSFLTRSQALLLDGHFFVEHHARWSGGHFFNFNGTAGVLRRDAIQDAGGWAADTLTEDLDLSYRMQIAGWRGVYLRDETCDGDLPATMADFKAQQRRWVEGSIQTARKLARALAASPLPLATRLEAGLHLLTNFAYPAMLAAFLLAAPAVRGAPGAVPLAGVTGLVAMLGVLTFYGVAHHEGAPPRSGFLARALHAAGAIAGALALGAGLAVSNSLAVARGLVRRGGHFERTPKLTDQHARPAGYRARIGLTPVAEIALGTVLAYRAALAIAAGMPLCAALFAVFAAGAIWVGAASLAGALEPSGAQ